MEDKKSKFSILSAKGSRSAVETTAQIIFTICSVVAVAAVFSITLYMIISGTPAIFKVGLLDILFEVSGHRRRQRHPTVSCTLSSHRS